MIMKSCNPYEFPDLGTGLNFFCKIMRSKERIHFSLNLKQWNSKCQSHMLECLFNSETILFKVGLRKFSPPKTRKSIKILVASDIDKAAGATGAVFSDLSSVPHDTE